MHLHHLLTFGRFWFLLMGTLSGINFAYRMLTVCIPSLRARLLLRHVRMRKGYDIDDLKMEYGDWFILYKLGENLNPVIFNELLQELIYTNENASDDDEKKSLTKHHICAEDPKDKSNSLIEKL